jgi:hypothetical protein
VANLKVSEGITLGDNANPFFMPGDIVSMFTSTIPDGWILCDGSEYLQISYPDLFNSASTYYNDGTETPGHFRVPNLSGSLANPVQPVGVVGSDNSGNISGGGYYNHTHSMTYTGISESTNDLNSHFHYNSLITGGNIQENYTHLHSQGGASGGPTNTTNASQIFRGNLSSTSTFGHSHSVTAWTIAGINALSAVDVNSTAILHKHNGNNNLNDSSATGGVTGNTNSTTDTSTASHYHTATYVAILSQPSSQLPTLYVKYMIKV